MSGAAPSTLMEEIVYATLMPSACANAGGIASMLEGYFEQVEKPEDVHDAVGHLLGPNSGNAAVALFEAIRQCAPRLKQARTFDDDVSAYELFGDDDDDSFTPQAMDTEQPAANSQAETAGSSSAHARPAADELAAAMPSLVRIESLTRGASGGDVGATSDADHSSTREAAAARPPAASNAQAVQPSDDTPAASNAQAVQPSDDTFAASSAPPAGPSNDTFVAAAAFLGLALDHARDWFAHLQQIQKGPGREEAAAAEAMQQSFKSGSGGVLYSTEPDKCLVCGNETTECLPCASAHKLCTGCRQANFINHIEMCPLKCGVFLPPPELYARYDRTFQNQENPLLRQLIGLDLSHFAEAAAEAKQAAEVGGSALTHTHKLLLQAKDLQDHFSEKKGKLHSGELRPGVIGLSDTQVADGKRDVAVSSEGNFRGLCFCSKGRLEVGKLPHQCNEMASRAYGELKQRYSFTQRCQKCNQSHERAAQKRAQASVKAMDAFSNAFKDETVGSQFWGSHNGPMDAQQRRMQHVQMHVRMQQQVHERKRVMDSPFKNMVTYVQCADSESVIQEMKWTMMDLMKVQRDAWSEESKRPLLRTRLELGLVYPMNFPLLQGFTMQGAAHHNKYGQLDSPDLSGKHYNPQLTPEARRLNKPPFVNWTEVRKQMVADLKAGKATWRDSYTVEPEEYGTTFWQTVGGNCPLPGSPQGGDTAISTETGQRLERPSALDIWLTPLQYQGIHVFHSEAEAILDLIRKPYPDANGEYLFGPHNEQARVAAGFGIGVGVSLNTMRRVREQIMEAEGTMYDGRVLNVSLREPMYPVGDELVQKRWDGRRYPLESLPDAVLPEFVHLSLKNTKSLQWDMIRYDTLECEPYLEQNEEDKERGLPPYLRSGWWTESRREGVPEYVRARDTFGWRKMPKRHPLANRALFYRAFPIREDWANVEKSHLLPGRGRGRGQTRGRVQGGGRGGGQGGRARARARRHTS